MTSGMLANPSTREMKRLAALPFSRRCGSISRMIPNQATPETVAYRTQTVKSAILPSSTRIMRLYSAHVDACPAVPRRTLPVVPSGRGVYVRRRRRQDHGLEARGRLHGEKRREGQVDDDDEGGHRR